MRELSSDRQVGVGVRGGIGVADPVVMTCAFGADDVLAEIAMDVEEAMDLVVDLLHAMVRGGSRVPDRPALIPLTSMGRDVGLDDLVVVELED